MCASQANSEVAAPTVLLVDDSDALRGILCEFLIDYGFNVLEAANGAAAIELFERYPTPVDLLVTDIQMPGITGLELADYLTEREPRMPVLYISINTASGVDAFSAPNRSFLPKPFDPDTFLQRVRELIESQGLQVEKRITNVS